MLAVALSGTLAGDYGSQAAIDDGGGGQSGSQDYRQESSLGGWTAVSATASGEVMNRVGYVGQLYEVAGFAVSESLVPIPGGSVLRLAAVAVLDDGSRMNLPTDEWSWSVASGPITVTTAGTVQATPDYDDVPAVVRVALGGVLHEFPVDVPPYIRQQPQGQVVPLGASITFRVNATGTGPLNYQWKFMGADLPGETSATLTINDADARHAGVYSVLVGNGAGSVVSATASLVTIIAPVLTISHDLELTLHGAAGSTYRIEATESLSGEPAWQPWVEVTLVSGSQSLRDPQASRESNRFHRAVWIPDRPVVGIAVSSAAVVVPEGGTAEFRVRLTAQPAGDVEVTTVWDSGDEDLAVSAGGRLTFTAANWSQDQTVTLRAKQDADALNGEANFVVSGGSTRQTVVAKEEDDDALPVGPPIITHFAPRSAPIGIAVNIAGVNFGHATNANTVWFGAARAVVTTASATNLTVTVPVGATYARPSVTVAGLTGTARLPFDPTFQSRREIDASSFSAPVFFAAGPWRADLEIADLDGDGKPDLAALDSDRGLVSVLRNTSVAGGVDEGSFAAKVDLAVGRGPEGVASGDLNGDGRLDLVVANTLGGSVSVFRNVSEVGALNADSFAPRIDFSVGTPYPQRVRILDLDMDGRPEIVVAAAQSSVVRVLRNLSQGTTVAMGPPQGIETDRADMRDVALGDFDADGQPDMAVVFAASSRMPLLRNASVPGSVSFLEAVHYGLPDPSFGVAVADLDVDGELDLAATTYGSDIVSVFRSARAGGGISFDPGWAFRSDEGTFRLEIGDLDGDGRPELVAGNVIAGTVSVFRNLSSPGALDSKSFGFGVNFTPGSRVYGLRVGDLDADGAPDIAVATEGQGIAVFRNLTGIR